MHFRFRARSRDLLLHAIGPLLLADCLYSTCSYLRCSSDALKVVSQIYDYGTLQFQWLGCSVLKFRELDGALPVIITINIPSGEQKEISRMRAKAESAFTTDKDSFEHYNFLLEQTCKREQT